MVTQQQEIDSPNIPSPWLAIPPVSLAPAARRAHAQLFQVQRLVVLAKFRYMGDSIVATPFLRHLRHHLPEAHITLLTSPSAATALHRCPYIDCLQPLALQGLGKWRASLALLSALRAGNYEAAFIINRSFRSALLCKLARIPLRLGYAREYSSPLLSVSTGYTFERHEADCHLDMLRVLGLQVADGLPELWFTEEERRHVRRHLCPSADIDSGLWIGIQPGANDAVMRVWKAERYAHIADRLHEEMGARIVLMGGSGEEAIAGEMAQAMRHTPINLVGKLELREALALIGQFRLWLGNDTGLLHSAVAQRVPTVGIYGPNKVLRWGYHTPQHRSLVFLPDCPVRDVQMTRSCLDAISEAEVLEAAKAVLQEATSENTPVNALGSHEAFRMPLPYYAASLPETRKFVAPRR